MWYDIKISILGSDASYAAGAGTKRIKLYPNLII